VSYCSQKEKALSFLLSVRHSHAAFGRACPIRYPSGRPENPRAIIPFVNESPSGAPIGSAIALHVTEIDTPPCLPLGAWLSLLGSKLAADEDTNCGLHGGLIAAALWLQEPPANGIGEYRNPVRSWPKHVNAGTHFGLWRPDSPPPASNRRG
jgi:hypothetical protein